MLPPRRFWSTPVGSRPRCANHPTCCRSLRPAAFMESHHAHAPRRSPEQAAAVSRRTQRARRDLASCAARAGAIRTTRPTNHPFLPASRSLRCRRCHPLRAGPPPSEAPLGRLAATASPGYSQTPAFARGRFPAGQPAKRQVRRRGGLHSLSLSCIALHCLALNGRRGRPMKRPTALALGRFSSRRADRRTTSTARLSPPRSPARQRPTTLPLQTAQRVTLPVP